MSPRSRLVSTTTCLFTCLVAGAAVAQESLPPDWAEVAHPIRHDGGIASFVVSTDGTTVALEGYRTEHASIWNVETGVRLGSVPTPSGSRIALSPDGSWLLVGNEEGVIELFESASARSIHRIQLPQLEPYPTHNDLPPDLRAHVNGVAVSPDGESFVTSVRPGRLLFWEAGTARLIREVELEPSIRQRIVFSPDGKWIVCGTPDRKIHVLEAGSGEVVHTLSGHRNRTDIAMDVGPDGSWFVSGSDDKTLKMWDISGGEEIRTFPGHTGGILSVAIGPEGRRIVSTADDFGPGGTLRFWDVESGVETHQVEYDSTALAQWVGKRIFVALFGKEELRIYAER